MEKERREQLGVDYTWLASNDSPVRRQYEIPEMKRIELEQMCGHVCPTECGRVLLAFRQLVADQQTLTPEEIPQLLRTTIGQVRVVMIAGLVPTFSIFPTHNRVFFSTVYSIIQC